MGRSRMPIARTRALNATPNARSLSRMRYLGAFSHGNASVIWRASHSAVGFRVTAIHNNCRRPWPRITNANSCSKAIVGTCPCRKLDPHVLVMQSAQRGAAEYATNGLDSAWDRRILVQG